MNGRCAGWGLVACLAVVCGRGFAQSAQPSCTPGMMGGGGSPVGPGPGGPPLLAVVKTTFDHKLSDGNSIHTESHGLMARDGAGRMMLQKLQSCGRDGSGQPLPRYMVSVSDSGTVPSTNTFWVAGDGMQETALISHPPNPQTAPIQARQSPSRAVMPDRSEYKRESLGYKTIGGVIAQGFRETRTIPAGEEGNAQELISVTETWKSKDLKMVVMWVQDDPRNGRTVSAVESITMGEPDPALFSPPKGYVLEERTP